MQLDVGVRPVVFPDRPSLSTGACFPFHTAFYFRGALLEFRPMRDLFTMILAGGKGERLHPLTDQRAKPAVPFGGKYRIIDITLSNCINSGLRKIAVLIQYKSHSLDRHIRMGWNIFNTELGEYIISVPPQQRISEDWYKGTADAVYQNLFLLDTEESPYLLILAGDHIYKMNYADMYQFMREKAADAVVGAIECPVAEATRFGVIGVDEEYRIQRFDEKPKAPMHIPGDPAQAFISMGIYLFKTDVLQAHLLEDAQTGTAHDFGKNIIPRMIANQRVFAFKFQDRNKKSVHYWRDIGTLDAYWEANMDLVSVDPLFNLYDQRWPIRTYQGQYPQPNLSSPKISKAAAWGSRSIPSSQAAASSQGRGCRTVSSLRTCVCKTMRISANRW